MQESSLIDGKNIIGKLGFAQDQGKDNSTKPSKRKKVVSSKTDSHNGKNCFIF